MNKADIFNQLKEIVGAENTSCDLEDILPYTRDSYTPMMAQPVETPDFIVMPRNTEQVQKIIKLANQYLIPVYPRSFGVNIAASALPYKGGMVIDLKRMDRIIEINEETMTATIEPGVSWGRLRIEANKKKLDTVPIAGPYQTSPIGNFLLTNITPYATRYSMDRAVTFETVLPNGEILRTGSQVTASGAELNPYVRYANGPDIAGLFRGSVGNFGLITKMVIRLRPLAEIERNYYFAFKSLEQILRAMKNIERLEITRYSQIYNKTVGMRCTAVIDDLINDAKRENLLTLMPEYTLVIGLGGNSKMITLYEELVKDEVKKQGGEELKLENKYMENLDTLSEGTSQSILRMFAPHGGYGAVIAMLPVSKVLEVHATVEEIVKKHDLRDPFTGKPLDTEIIIYSYDRCSIVYLEHELLYDPLDSEAIRKEMACIRECYAVLTRKFGACHTMPNRSLLRSMLPSYVDILVGIKNLVDPNGIFLSGGPYTLEK